MAEQLDWYLDQPYDNLNTWMYDRVQVLYEYYLRTGDESVHAEATRSAIEYVKHYTRNGGSGGWPDCNGGWSHAGVNKCDAKFTHVSALYYLKEVDGIESFDADLLSSLEDYSMAAGWFVPAGPYDSPNIKWNERVYGLMLTNLVYLHLLGSSTAMENIDRFINWFYDHQQSPSFDQFTGAWLHSYYGHEGFGEPGSANDARTFSPWMSAMVIGGLWRAYQINPDERIGEMIVDFAQALEDYGFITNPTSWRHPYNDSGQIAWYLAFPNDSARQQQVMDNDGWYADTHLPEIQCMVAAGFYFSQSQSQKAAFQARFEAIEPFYNTLMAGVSFPARLFAWQHSHNPSCEWFMENG